MKKFILTYTPGQKGALDYALNIATKWYEGDIQPICEVMLKAFKRHHPKAIYFDSVIKTIGEKVNAIRNMDVTGVAFGRSEILKTIQLPESGEVVLTEDQEMALEHLSDWICRLIAGQLEICFSRLTIPYLIPEDCDELERHVHQLHIICWNMPPHANYGSGYDEMSDILWDIYQVLRHERYLNFSDEVKEEMRLTVMANKPMITSREPLMGIKTIP